MILELLPYLNLHSTPQIFIRYKLSECSVLKSPGISQKLVPEIS